MRHVPLLAALTILAAAPIAEAATLKSYEISGAFADGGHFDGGFTNGVPAADRCPDPGIGCFYFPKGRITGEYADGPILADASLPIHDLWYQLRSDGDRNTINFVFSAYNPGQLEFGIQAKYRYLGPADLDLPWNGEFSAIGGFLSGSIENDRGYNTAMTEQHLAPVPLPAALPLLGTGLLGLFAIGRRGRNRRDAQSA